MFQAKPNPDMSGQRIEMLPHTNTWMRGARYGTCLGKRGRGGCYRIKLDAFTKPHRVHPSNFRFLGEALADAQGGE